MRRGIKALIWGGVAAGAVALTVSQYVDKVVAESYSPGFSSESVADAHRRGVFIKEVAVTDPSMGYPGGDVRIREAWIEDRQQIYYRYLFFRRDSLLHRPYLIVRLEREQGGPRRCARVQPVFRDEKMNMGPCGTAYRDLEAPYPDTVAVTVAGIEALTP